MTVAEEKRALRTRLRALQAQWTDGARRESDRAIARQVCALAEFQSATRIFAYCSVAPEPDTHEIIAAARALGKTVALPVTEGNGAMHFAAAGKLVPGRYGIPEPPPGARALVPEAGDLLLVPAMAYDRGGFRLGRGGGYYDRCLAAAAGTAVGLARSAFLFDSLPRAWNDLPVHLVVTEDAALHPR